MTALQGSLSKRHAVVGLGEALFDVFPQQTILGGAPLNVAVMADQLLADHGGEGIVASRVGDDALGQRIRRELTQRGSDPACVQCDADHPTGQVVVQVVDGEPSYEIVTNVAWDFLQWTEAWQSLARQCSAVCFGTLAQRSEVSRQTIQAFAAAATDAIRLFDVNLRQDFYCDAVLRESLAVATVVKLNEHELPIVLRLAGLDADAGDNAVKQLREQCALDAIVLTRGAAGTSLYTAAGRTTGEPANYPRRDNADTVGAGDACAAAVITGMLLRWPDERTVHLANHVGAFVASQPGATPTLPNDLRRLVRTE